MFSGRNTSCLWRIHFLSRRKPDHGMSPSQLLCQTWNNDGVYHFSKEESGSCCPFEQVPQRCPRHKVTMAYQVNCQTWDHDGVYHFPNEESGSCYPFEQVPQRCTRHKDRIIIITYQTPPQLAQSCKMSVIKTLARRPCCLCASENLNLTLSSRN